MSNAETKETFAKPTAPILTGGNDFFDRDRVLMVLARISTGMQLKILYKIIFNLISKYFQAESPSVVVSVKFSKSSA